MEADVDGEAVDDLQHMKSHRGMSQRMHVLVMS